MPVLASRLAVVVLMGSVGCVDLRDREDPTDWFDPGDDFWVLEHIDYTDQNYDFGQTDGIGAFENDFFPINGSWGFVFEQPKEMEVLGPRVPNCDFEIDSRLPKTVRGVVTLHPRFYFKTDGCTGASDEKYYGSYFIQDGSGGVFVTGDSKVAHFVVGNTVELNVRGAATSYDLDMIYAYDVVSIERTDVPIYYEMADGPLGFDDAGEVRRVVGEVTTEKDTFGEFTVTMDDGTDVLISMDSEISRRGAGFPIGTQVQITGPVYYSYNEHKIVVMQFGQLQTLE